MRSCFGTVLVVLAVAALAPAAHASDERHGPRVGSLVAAQKPALPVLQDPAAAAPQPRADSLANGIGIGALIGGATGLALMGWAYNQCDDTCDAPEPAPMYLMAGGVGAAVGGVVGLIIDKARKNTNQRVSVGGVVAANRSHVLVTLRW